ncbi:MAG: hypothetical protein ACYDHN_17045 [Solirubrobacteraceae bacterium]
MGDPSRAASTRTQRIFLAGMYVVLAVLLLLGRMTTMVGLAYLAVVAVATGLVVFRALRGSE